MASSSLLRPIIIKVSSHTANRFSLLKFSVNVPQSLQCLQCKCLRRFSSISRSSNILYARFLQSGCKQRELSSMSKEDDQAISTPVSLKERLWGAFQRLGWFATRSSILHYRARKIYGCCTDGVDYKEFFKVCNMPDTFQSWFLIIHLHVWMCYVRLNLFEDDGRVVNQKMAELMWEDIRERINLLGIEDTKVKKESFKELSKQFYGLTIAYNKAFMSENEKDFADAIWRNIFSEKGSENRQNLKIILQYIDKQITMLDSMTKEELLGVGKVDWIPLKDVLKAENV